VMFNTKEVFGGPLKSKSSMSPESSADRGVLLGRPKGGDDCARGDRCCVHVVERQSCPWTGITVTL
jgi:hypothetical protein